jgi:P4 family phage/plasmid primase-like protien
MSATVPAALTKASAIPDLLEAAKPFLTPDHSRVQETGDPADPMQWTSNIDFEQAPSQVQYLINRGVDPWIADERGYRLIDDLQSWSIPSRTGQIQFKFSSDFNIHLDGIKPYRPLGIPMYSLLSENRAVCIQLRPLEPWVIKDAKGNVSDSIKFIAPAGIKRGSYLNCLPADIHPLAHDWAADVQIPMIITEGVIKGDSILTAVCREGLELVPVSLTGVTMGYYGAGTENNPGLRARLVDETLGMLDLKRLIFLAWDSDWHHKAGVYGPMLKTARLLQEAGAHVMIVDVPPVAGSGTGIDDYLAHAYLDKLEHPLAKVLASAITVEEARAITAHFTDDDSGRGERLAVEMLRNGSHRASSTTGDFLRWTGTHWADDQAGTAEHLALRLTDRIQDSNARTAGRSLRAIIAATKIAARFPGVSVQSEELDRDPFLLNTMNGTVDLHTGVLQPHNPADLISHVTSCGYDPDAVAPTWDRFLLETFKGDENLVRFFQLFVGMAAIGKLYEEIMVILVGFGRNGKSLTIETLKAILAGYAGTFVPDALMEGKARDEHLVALRGKRLMAAAETRAGQVLDEATLKRFTSRDGLTARDLYEKRIYFIPTHSMMLSTNHPPVITAQDEGTWRRIRILPFLNQLTANTEDTDLPTKLLAEASGILKWIVDGARAYIDAGFKLGTVAAVERATATYRHQSDLLGSFLDECCVVAPTLKGKRASIYARFQGFAIEQGRRPWTQRAMLEALQERGIVPQGAAAKSNGDYYWIGLALDVGGDKAIAEARLANRPPAKSSAQPSPDQAQPTAPTPDPLTEAEVLDALDFG